MLWRIVNLMFSQQYEIHILDIDTIMSVINLLD